MQLVMKYTKFSYLGRACMLIDVIIDTIGIAIGVVMVYFIIEMINRRKK